MPDDDQFVRKVITTGGRRAGKSIAARIWGDFMLDQGKTVIALGRDGKPIVSPDWWKKKP